jgi:hypothetical protein
MTSTSAHARELHGDRNQCAGCGEYFNSSAAFEKHRTGAYGSTTGDGIYLPSSRRCRSIAEMEAAGMAKNSNGWWITAPNPMEFDRGLKEPA